MIDALQREVASPQQPRKRLARPPIKIADRGFRSFSKLNLRLLELAA